MSTPAMVPLGGCGGCGGRGGPPPSSTTSTTSTPRLERDLHERCQLTLHVADTDLGGEPLGDGEVRVGERRGRVQGHRPARVRAGANLSGERNLAEEGNPQALRRTARR